MMADPKPLKMFLSYSRKDKVFLDELRAHLANLREEGLIEDWHDNEVQAGDEWEKEIMAQLKAAEVILLLISADFNNSQFCRKIEMQRAVERHGAGTALVVPVIVRPVEALPQEIQHLQCLPDPKKPIEVYPSRDVAYAEVVAALRKRLQRLRSPNPVAEPKDGFSDPGPLVLPLGDRSEVLQVGCEFQQQGDGYRLVVRVGFEHPQSVTVGETVRLGELERLVLGDGSQVTLGQIAGAMDDGRWRPVSWFDESAQLVVGRKLFDETVGRIDAVAGRAAVDLRIATDDEHLRRLPWPLLNRRGIFLMHEAWTIGLTRANGEMPTATLPSHPDILVIAPDPYPDRPTGGADHANDLRTLLREAKDELGSPDKFVEVRTWDELQRATISRSFDVVYFYGHAIEQGGAVHLVFSSADGRNAEPRSVVEFAHLLRKMNPRPVLAYVNSTLGDSGNLLGVGNQLGSFLPCVVANRVAARPAVARKQACGLFRQILLDTAPPEQALMELQHDLSREQTEGVDPAWYTPVLYANYCRWSHASPRDQSLPRIHPDWRWLVDRKNQYGTTTQRLRDIVQRQIKKRALAIIAYGEPGNGLTHFRDRIRRFVHGSVSIDGNTYQPSWPPYRPRDVDGATLLHRDFQQIIQTCGRPTLRELAREFRQGVASTKALTVFNHAIVSSPEILNSRRLFEYIEWWGHQLDAEIDDQNLFFLFAFYFEVPGSSAKATFEAKIKAARREAAQRTIDVELLLPLTEIDEDDLLQFIDDHGLFIPDKQRVTVADQIIRKSGGCYEQAIALLELVVHQRYYELLDQQQQPEESQDAHDDW